MQRVGMRGGGFGRGGRAARPRIHNGQPNGMRLIVLALSLMGDRGELLSVRRVIPTVHDLVASFYGVV